MADSLIIRIDGDASGYEKALKQVEDGVEDINKLAKKVALGVGAVGTAVVGTGIKYNAEMEQYKAGFETMLGSAKEADKTINSLKSFAEKTPFELTDLANASTTLLAFGEDINNLMPDLKMLGDISLGNQEKFKSLALVFGQVQSQGKLMGQDLLQMINQGFNPLQVISKKTGESMASLKDKMSQGEISFEMVAEAMRIATSEGGQFYNAMDRQSKTLTGQLSTLKDNIVSFAGDVSSSLSEELTSEVLPMLIDKVEELKEAWEDGRLQKALKITISLLAAFGGAVAALNIILFIEDMRRLTSGVKDFTAATKLGTAAQKAFNLEQSLTPTGLLITGLAAVTAGVITYAATHKSAAADIAKSHKEAIKAIDENVKVDLAQAETAIVLKDRLFELEQQINDGKLSNEEATVAQEEFNGTANKLNEIIPGIIDNIYDENGAIALQRGEVESLTKSFYELAYAKAMANAYQAKIDQTAQDLVKVKEKLKPYETGEKSKMITKGLMAGAIMDGSYISLLDQQDKLTKEMNGYVSELQSYQKEISKTVEDGAKETTNTVRTGNRAKTASTKTETKKQSEEMKKQLEKQLRDLEFYHSMGEVSDADYYKELAKIRDEYFDEGSEEWQEYTLQIHNYNKKIKEDTVREFEDILEEQKNVALENIAEIESAQKAFAESLRPDSLLETVTTTLGGEKYDVEQLKDWRDDNKSLKEYKERLERVSGRLKDVFGEDAEGYDEIIDLMRKSPKGEGGKLLAYLDMTDEKEFSDFIKGYQENKELTEEIAGESFSDERSELQKRLKEQFDEIPEEFFDIGVDAAEQFDEGFKSQLKEMVVAVKEMLLRELSFLAPSQVEAFFNGLGTNVTNYSSTYNVLPAKGESTQQQIEALKNAETYKQMQGGY